MPSEIGRVTSVRRIVDPSDQNPSNPSNYVDLRIIDGISFIDPKDNYQETQFTYDNTDQSSRQAHVVEVSGGLRVEWPDQVNVLDPKQNYQETRHGWRNDDDPPKHLKTHDVKVKKRDASGNVDESGWLKIRRVDQADFIDPKDNYQETIYELAWNDSDPTTGDDANLPGPTTTWDGTSINPPWRVDPFQQIIDSYWANLDGYIAFIPATTSSFVTADGLPLPDTGVPGGVQITGGSTPPPPPGVYTVKLNGKTITTVTVGTDVSDLTPLVLITFGRTALRQHSSENDSLNTNSPFAPIDAARHDRRLFKYPHLNPRNYVQPNGIGNSLLSHAGDYFTASPIVINYPDIASSPLKPVGTNVLTITLNADAPAGYLSGYWLSPTFPLPPWRREMRTHVSGECVVWAEFYSRNPKALRRVDKGWRGTKAIVNDKAQTWGADKNLYPDDRLAPFDPTLTLNIDLTPANMAVNTTDLPGDYWWTVDGGGQVRDALGRPIVVSGGVGSPATPTGNGDNEPGDYLD
jgi:hypothetical protein